MEPAQRDDEIFDVVDALDRVISQATRREVHDQGLLHRAVHILILNSSGEVEVERFPHQAKYEIGQVLPPKAQV